MFPTPPPDKSVKAVDAHGDVYVISFPKCGRTWLRVLMAKAISAAHHIPMEACRNLDLTGFSDVSPAVPRIVFWHDDRVLWRTPGELSRDKDFYHDRKVVLILRDIRDTAVSCYFQQTRRQGRPYDAGLGAFLSEERGSVRTCLSFWNIWHARQHVPAGFLVTSYERLTADTAGELSRILGFCGLPPAGDQALRAAVDFAGFDSMRAMELSDALGTDRLRPAVPGDPDSYKTRRGVIGGFRDYLTGPQIDYVNDAVRRILAPAWHPAALAADTPLPQRP
ncbi:sulfotransferase domain-containing protein [Streptomyces hiroshimensis]|uniref:Sulfotransferase n=1 Tax=Streptomyces hiroshimensis TaxID=66424 RepID=A0ABQ2Z2A9_9ACTN|nr:sulfotransferase domain-containing protein [Streptomyces hiroshimensis]GGY02623.1 sulfotransferase [Streptomyces hiroshimensis]